MSAMTMRTMRVGGAVVHVPTPAGATPAKPKKAKARIVPDPIKTNGEASAEELRQIVERVERIDEEIAGAQEDKRDVLAEAKSRGYNTRQILRIVDRRKKDKHILDEEEAVFETYLDALGMLS